ncbi:MAG: hypothetical protein HY698_21205 [Deltaproteobacteria bacterium]|nr:hypothetical protein [Deltaproteobacteria bacterium]
MPREKEPGMDIEEAKGRLRLEEIDAEASKCTKCTAARKSTGDDTAYCDEHLRKIYGI